MSKGKRKDYNKPILVHKSVREKIAELKGLKFPKPPNPRKDKLPPVVEFKFDRGFDFGKREGFWQLGIDPAQPGGGYIPIPEGKKLEYYYDESGIWDKEALAQLLGTEPQEAKNPTDEWVEKWLKDND